MGCSKLPRPVVKPRITQYFDFSLLPNSTEELAECFVA